MRERAQVCSSFWDWRIKTNASPDATLIAQFLMTSKEGNVSGVYCCHMETISHYTGIPGQRVKKAMTELEDVRFIFTCDKTGWVVLPMACKWNNLNGPKHESATVKNINHIPIISHLREACESAIEHGLDGFGDRLIYTLSEGVSDTLSDTDKEIKREEDKYISGTNVPSVPYREPKKESQDIYEKIKSAWNEILGDVVPKCRKVPKANAKVRMQEYPELKAIEGWIELFKSIRDERPHCIGKNDRGWKVDIAWVCNKSGMDRLMNGRFIETEERDDGSVEAHNRRIVEEMRRERDERNNRGMDIFDPFGGINGISDETEQGNDIELLPKPE